MCLKNILISVFFGLTNEIIIYFFMIIGFLDLIVTSYAIVKCLLNNNFELTNECRILKRITYLLSSIFLIYATILIIMTNLMVLYDIF